MNNQGRTRSRWILISTLSLLVLLAGAGLTQTDASQDEVCIQRVAASFRVYWRVLNNGEEVGIDRFDRYVLHCATDPNFMNMPTPQVTLGNSANSHAFIDLEAGNIYYFRIEGVRQDGSRSPSEIFTYDATNLSGTDFKLSPAYWVLKRLDSWGFMRGSLDAMRESTPPGRAAFELISILLLTGLVVLLVTLWQLRSTKVFLVDRTLNGGGELGRAIEGARDLGIDAERNLSGEERKKEHGPNAKKLHRLIQKIVTRRAFQSWWWPVRWLPETIKPDFLVRFRAGKNQRNVNSFNHNPTIRVLKTASAVIAGMVRRATDMGSTQGVSGNDTSQSSSTELETALEVRIAAEEEDLRKRSGIDGLWAIGVTAPLLGLFGTVTGLSKSFKNVMTKVGPEGIDLKLLSDGIYEALFTTIFGLTVGIVFMLAYYYYQYKLDRIHAAWAMFIARFIDTFRHEVGETTMSQIPGSEENW